MKFKSYPKIRQYKDIVRDVQFKANYKGLNAEGAPIYEETEKPTLTFIATTKLHGTNAQVCYDGKKLLAGKRGSLIGADELTAHFGFNQFVQIEKREFFISLMKEVYGKHCTEGQQIMLYGEWAGKGIQKSVGISELDKSFYIFDCRVWDPNTDEHRWLDISAWEFETSKVYNINEFPTWGVNIDFNQPGMFQNKLVGVTEGIEKECPVSKELGIKNSIGEGAVWVSEYQGERLQFKVKGEKHSTSKVKKLASADPEVLKSIQEFVEYACTPNRIEQGLMETGATNKSHTPDLLRWVANDIIAEETDTLVANGLEWKQVAKDVSNLTRRYFFTKIDKV